LIQSAARLGVVTTAANHHESIKTTTGGQPYVNIARDSAPMPKAAAKAKGTKREAVEAKLDAAVPAKPTPVVLPQPIPEPTASQIHTNWRKRKRAAHQDELHERERLATAAAIVGTTANARPPPVSAAERMASLRARRGLVAHADETMQPATASGTAVLGLSVPLGDSPAVVASTVAHTVMASTGHGMEAPAMAPPTHV
jgi:hypothetical protein